VRDKIIEAAKKRFFQFGLRKVTMDEIATDLGISKKTLYKHFDSKEGLAAEVINAFQTEMTRLVDCLTMEISDPIERFERCVIEISRKRSAINNIFLSDIKREIPKLWKRIEEFREECIMNYLGDILQEGIKQGRIKKEINTKIAAKIYIGAIQTVMQPDAVEREGYSFEEAFDNISRIFMEGVKLK